MAEANKPKSNPAASNPILQVLQDRFSDAHASLLRSATPEATTASLAALSDSDFDALAPLLKRARDSKQKTFNYQGYTIPVPNLSALELSKQRSLVQEQNNNLLDSSFSLIGDQGKDLKNAAASFLGIKLKSEEEKAAAKKTSGKQVNAKNKQTKQTVKPDTINTDSTPTVQPETKSTINQKNSPLTTLTNSSTQKTQPNEESTEADDTRDAITAKQDKDKLFAEKKAAREKISAQQKILTQDIDNLLQWSSSDNVETLNIKKEKLIEKIREINDFSKANTEASSLDFEKSKLLNALSGIEAHLEQAQSIAEDEQVETTDPSFTAALEQQNSITQDSEGILYSSASDTAEALKNKQVQLTAKLTELNDLIKTRPASERFAFNKERSKFEIALAHNSNLLQQSETTTTKPAENQPTTTKQNETKNIGAISADLTPILTNKERILSASHDPDITEKEAEELAASFKDTRKRVDQLRLDSLKLYADKRDRGLALFGEKTISSFHGKNSDKATAFEAYLSADPEIQASREVVTRASTMLSEAEKAMALSGNDQLYLAYQKNINRNAQDLAELRKTVPKATEQDKELRKIEKDWDTIATNEKSTSSVNPVAMAAGVAGAALGLASTASAASAAISGAHAALPTKKISTTTQSTSDTETQISGKVEQTTKNDITAKTTITSPETASSTPQGDGRIDVKATSTTTAQTTGGKKQSTGPAKIDVSAKTSIAVPPTPSSPPLTGGASIQAKLQARQKFQHAPASPAAGQKITVQGKRTINQPTQNTTTQINEVGAENSSQIINEPEQTLENTEESFRALSSATPVSGAQPQTSGSQNVLSQSEKSKIQTPIRRTTGSATPPIVRKPTTSGSNVHIQIGPQISRPLGSAMQLGAAQQRARAFASPQTPVEQLLGDSSVPPDISQDILSDRPRISGSTNSGFYNPLEQKSSYAMSNRAPGSIASAAENEELDARGGSLPTDEDNRAQALSSAQQQQRALQANMPGGAGLAIGAGAAIGSMQGSSNNNQPQTTTQKEDEQTSEEDIEAEEDETDLDSALLLDAAQQSQRQQAVQGGAAGGIQGTVTAAKNVEKNLQNIWRVVNSVEILDAEFIFPIFMWLITANLQLINKHTFKVKFIPEAHMIEDALTCCVDCVLGIAGCLNLFLMFIILAIYILPFIIGGSALVEFGSWLSGMEGINSIFK